MKLILSISWLIYWRWVLLVVFSKLLQKLFFVNFGELHLPQIFIYYFSLVGSLWWISIRQEKAYIVLSLPDDFFNLDGRFFKIFISALNIFLRWFVIANVAKFAAEILFDGGEDFVTYWDIFFAFPFFLLSLMWKFRSVEDGLLNPSS